MASASQPPRGIAAVGHERSRLAGRPRRTDAADQHDRRCDQPVVCPFRAERLDGGKHERAGAVHEKARSAAGGLHRPGGIVKTTQKAKPNEPVAAGDRSELPPTQLGRALQELGIVWIPAYSPQAKGRVERGFATAQDRLVKGMRVAGVKTLEQANHYLETEFLPWVNTTLAVQPASADDAHRPLETQQDLAAILSYVESRRVNNDYTIQLCGKIYQIARQDIRTGLRGAVVRVEKRRDGSVAVRFRDRYLRISICEQRPKLPAPKPSSPTRHAPKPGRTREWRKNFDLKKSPKIWQASEGSGAKPELL